MKVVPVTANIGVSDKVNLENAYRVIATLKNQLLEKENSVSITNKESFCLECIDYKSQVENLTKQIVDLKKTNEALQLKLININNKNIILSGRKSSDNLKSFEVFSVIIT